MASILASLWNENILDAEHQTLQDTNDRFLANMQRGGLYSVVPRVPGGEITPEKLIALGRVAKKYGLYTKITGGQRIDLFGAQVQQLPDIWEELVDAGFESGHAYGKALRTVKSCVGTTWCRYGVQDSVGFAIRVENRYKGIRAPHKIKMAVSGCIRECAEAQSKDVGLIATEKGYNLYVCGNGGAKPRHADLLAADLDEETALKYIDRFLMYYIHTADRLTRTSVWLREARRRHRLPARRGRPRQAGHLPASWKRMMQRLVDTYQCEWAAVVRDPEKRKLFRQFVNTDETELVHRDRHRARPEPPGRLAQDDCVARAVHGARPLRSRHRMANERWRNASRMGLCRRGRRLSARRRRHRQVRQVQIAVFNFASRGEWYACQNMCPHKKAFVLSRGIIGDAGGTPKVACPLHKKTFSLETGDCLSGDEYSVKVFPVKVADGQVHLLLPSKEQLDALLATDLHCITSCMSSRVQVEPMLVEPSSA